MAKACPSQDMPVQNLHCKLKVSRGSLTVSAHVPSCTASYGKMLLAARPCLRGQRRFWSTFNPWSSFQVLGGLFAGEAPDKQCRTASAALHTRRVVLEEKQACLRMSKSHALSGLPENGHQTMARTFNGRRGERPDWESLG